MHPGKNKERNIDEYQGDFMTKLTMHTATAQNFNTNSGLKRANGLTFTIFNAVPEYVIGRIPMETKGTLLLKSSQLVAYVDDINIMTRSILEARANLCRNTTSKL